MAEIDPLVARVAALLHNRAHYGWHRWFEDGHECPDGRADSDAWVEKALLLISDIDADGLVLHENQGECYLGDRMLAARRLAEAGPILREDVDDFYGGVAPDGREVREP